MDSVVIRKAKLEDLPRLLEFEQEIVESERLYDCTLKPGHISFYDLEKLISNDNSVIIVVELNGLIIASGSAEIRLSEVFEKFAKYSYLGFMYVAPEYRKKGVNSLILKALISWSESNGVEELCLNVCEQNQAAISAYEKVGFSKISTKMRMNLNEFQE